MFIKKNRGLIVLFIGILIAFGITFPLYQLPLVVMIYPMAVVLAFMIIYLTVDYITYRRRYRRLIDCENSIDEISEHLPEHVGEIEEEYQQLLQILKRASDEKENIAKEKYTQMMDYYTMWVHQVKTPIASMRLVLEGEDTDTSRKISADLRRIEQYVEMVLTYLRLDFDSSDYVFRENDLDELLKTSVKKFARDFIGKKLSLSYEPLERKIITDKKWFSFVIEQILSNAVKYTKDGGIKIYVQEDWLVIEDSGIGIASEDLPRIFEKGYTGFNGRGDEKSSGIGLYLCKRICDKLGTILKIESEVGCGTRVFVALSQSEVNFRD